MYLFRDIREAKGSKAKLQLAIDKFTDKHHNFMEVCFNFKVYGISGAGIGKAIMFDFKDYGKCEDYGEYLEKLDKDGKLDGWFEKTTYNYNIDSVVTALMDKSGNAQIERLQELLGGFESYEIPWLIRAIQKNMRIGLNLTSYNKVRIAHGKEPIEGYGVQLCGKVPLNKEDWDWMKFPKIAEYKYDGERSDIDITRTDEMVTVTLTSRGGADITERYPEVVTFLQKCFQDKREIKHVKYDSEIISSSFIKLSTRMHRKKENITEHDDSLKPIIFDILECNGREMRNLPQKERREIVDKHADLYEFDTSYMEIVNDVDELYDFYLRARSINQEGVVTKEMDMTWTPHSRDGWCKLVPKENLDLEVIDSYYGNGRNSKYINGVWVTNKARTIKSKVSTGIKDFEREELTRLYNAGELIGKIVEVEFRELQPPKEGVSSLRFPVFKRIRDDKFIAD